MNRPFNFGAGPATLPTEVLLEAQAEFLDWQGSGMNVMEFSHRSADFMALNAQAQADLRELLAIPEHFKVLFMQGGAQGENAIVPMNISRGQSLDVVVTGAWSKKSLDEARKYAPVRVVGDNSADQHRSLPAASSWSLDPKAAYVHICSNETIHGVQFGELPDLKALGSDAPLVVDACSDMLSRPVDWSRVGVMFAGAQKNIGPAGLTVVVVREDLVGHALPICPSAFDYQKVADNDSLYNTPPMYSIYLAGLVFKWLKRQGGLSAVAAVNRRKAALVYGQIDGSSGFYTSEVARDARSEINVPFFLPSQDLTDLFLAGAKARGLLQLKGHKMVGGIRASLYNAMPLEGVQALCQYMTDFQAQHG